MFINGLSSGLKSLQHKKATNKFYIENFQYKFTGANFFKLELGIGLFDQSRQLTA